MSCNHDRIEEMCGIYFCATCGEETEVTLGHSKEGFWKIGPERKRSSEEKLFNAMQWYNFPDDITLEASNFYASVKKVDSKIRKKTAYDSFYHAFIKLTGTVDKELLARMLDLKKVPKN